MQSAEKYEAWYHTPRGNWIANREFRLMSAMMQAKPDSHILDVGCGTGYFSRRFVDMGYRVTGIDPNGAWLDFARELNPRIAYQEADACLLPFENESFDYVAAITSLCFIPKPEQALSEMWRVSRRGVFLGLLNRHSILYHQKHGRGAYQGARWDTEREVKAWTGALRPKPVREKHQTAISLPNGSLIDRALECILPGVLPWGGFLGVFLEK